MPRKDPSAVYRPKSPRLLKNPLLLPETVEVMETIATYGYDPRFLKPKSAALLICRCSGGCGLRITRSRAKTHENVKCQSCINKGRGPWTESRRIFHSAMMKSWISERGGSPWKGKKPTPETRAKMSESAKKRVRPKSKLKRPAQWKPHKGRGLRFLYQTESLKFWVRSSWERALIDFLNEKSLEFQYEPKKFIVTYIEDGVKKSSFYTPDFYIPSLSMWWEVKGRWTNIAKLKYEAFLEQYPEEKIRVLYERDLLDMGVNVLWTPEEKSLLRMGVWPRNPNPSG